MLNHPENAVNAREEKFREIVTKAIVCQNEACPVTADVEATIRQTLLAADWTQEPVFDDYVEEYLW